MTQESLAEPIVSSVEVNTKTPITSVRIISERAAIVALVHAEGADPVRLVVDTHATVKVTEVFFDLDDPSHITVNTY